MRRRPLTGILAIGGERTVVSFDADSTERIRRALVVGSGARRQQLERAVRGYLDEHPDASANQIVRVLGGNRQEVLRAVRVCKGLAQREGQGPQSNVASGERPVLRPGNQPCEVNP